MKYLIDGCYGDGNLGDEALLHAILQVVRRQDPDADCCVLSSDPNATAGAHLVRSVFQTNPLGVSVYGAVCKGLLKAVVREIRRCDVYILGGGELLRDDVGIRATFGILYRLILAAAFGKKVIMMGVGAQPPTTVLGGWLIRRAVRSSDGILLRDVESYELLSPTAAKGTSIRWSPDIAFSLGGSLPPRSPTESRPAQPLVVGVALKGLAFKRSNSVDGERLLDVIASTCLALARPNEVEYKAIAFSPHDLSCADDLAKKIAAKGLAVETVLCSDVAETLGFLRSLDVLFAMPLHASILALANGIPCCGIAYDRKVKRLYDQAGLQAYCVAFDDAREEQLFAIAERCLGIRGSFGAVNVFAATAKRDAEQAMSDVLRQVSL